MILLNQDNRLGRKAYLLMLFKSFVPPIVIFAIATVVLVSARGIGDLIFVIFKLAGSDTASTSATIAQGVSFVIQGAFALGVVSLIMSFVTTSARYRRYTFAFEEFGLRLRKGGMRITELTIPYRQMQDIQIDRGFLHQITGTSRLVIDSAGNEDPGTRFRPDEEADIVLDPIEREIAEEIRLMLQRKIGVQVVEGEREADREAMEQSAPEPTPTQTQ